MGSEEHHLLMVSGNKPRPDYCRLDIVAVVCTNSEGENQIPLEYFVSLDHLPGTKKRCAGS